MTAMTTMRRYLSHACQAVLLLGLWLGLGRPAHAQADTVYVYYTDPQGTPLAKADIHGNILARYDYTPYGSPATALGNPPNGPGYTGHVNDPESGLVYMQQRYYDPLTGRFLSPDPVTTYSNPLGAFNRYWYADGNPILNVDPDGTTCKKSGSGSYTCQVDGNTGGFNKDQIRMTNKAYTNAVNRLSLHPNVTVKVTVKGVSFLAKAGDVAKGLANAIVDTAPASRTERAVTVGGGLVATSNYFLNYTPKITIFQNAVTSDRFQRASHIQRDLERTFAHEGIHTLPRENVFFRIYRANQSYWGVIHRDAYNAAGNELLDGGK